MKHMRSTALKWSKNGNEVKVAVGNEYMNTWKTKVLGED
jgi:hypothetical protein